MRTLLALVALLLLIKAYENGCAVSINGETYSVGFKVNDSPDMGR